MTISLVVHLYEFLACLIRCYYIQVPCSEASITLLSLRPSCPHQWKGTAACGPLHHQPLLGSPPLVSSHHQRLSGAIPRHSGDRMHRLRRCHSHSRSPSASTTSFPLSGGAGDITFAVGIAVGTFTGQVAVALNIQPDIEKNYVFRIISLQMCSLCMCFSFCSKVLLRMQSGALGGLGREVGVKHQIVQHCGALEWYIKT